MPLSGLLYWKLILFAKRETTYMCGFFGKCCLSEVSSWSRLGKTVLRKNLLLRKKEKTVKQTEAGRLLVN